MSYVLPQHLDVARLAERCVLPIVEAGGGAGKRALYSDSDEILFHGRSPYLLTGIEDYPQRADLVDRCNIFGLEVVKERERLSDLELQQKFTKAAPAILGALLRRSGCRVKEPARS